MPRHPCAMRTPLPDRRCRASGWPASRRRTIWCWGGSRPSTDRYRVRRRWSSRCRSAAAGVGQPAARSEGGAPGDEMIALLSWQSRPPVIAAMPVAIARQASAPSISAMRCSSISHRGILQPRIGHALLLAGEARGGIGRLVIGVTRGEEERLARLAIFGARGAAAHRLRGGAPASLVIDRSWPVLRFIMPMPLPGG
jgi:hypothetical protein